MKKHKNLTAIIVACSFLVVSCSEAPRPQAPQEYAVLKVETVDRQVPISYSASIHGRQDIQIMPQVSGTIAHYDLLEGQTVKKGDVLFIIDQVPFKAALRTANANVEAAKAGVATAQLIYDSKKELYAKKIVSKFDLQTAENSLLTAKAQLSQAEAQRVNAANNLSYTEVKSPGNGVVGDLPYVIGDLVGPSIRVPLTVVSDNSDMYIYFSLTENRLYELTRQYGTMKETLKNLPKIKLQLNDGEVYSLEGFVESISGVINPSTGCVLARAVFPNPNGLLRTGGAGNIIMPHTFKDCIVIPQAATFEVQDKVFVYKLEDGKAISYRVEVEPISNGKEYIVREGLKSGDIIVAEGVGLLREGTPIVAQSDKKEQPAAQTPTSQEAKQKQKEE